MSSRGSSRAVSRDVSPRNSLESGPTRYPSRDAVSRAQDGRQPQKRISVPEVVKEAAYEGPQRKPPCTEAQFEKDIMDQFVAMNLGGRVKEVKAWADEMGAATIDEVFENADDLAQALRLKPLEKKRLMRAVANKG